MKRSTKIVSAVVAGLMFVGGATAYAKYRFADPEARAAHVIERISDKLDLNDAQKSSLVVLKDEMMTAKQSMRAELGENFDSFQSLITAETFDQTQAMNMIAAKTRLVEQRAPQVLGAMATFLDGLSVEQKQEIADFMKNHRKHGHRKGGHGFHRGGNHDRNDDGDN